MDNESHIALNECIKCKKQIPPESTFCLYCGERQIPVEQRSINTNPPVYIGHVDLWLTGPRDVRDGGWTKSTQVGRWINFRFNLKDEFDQYTACNGEIVIAVLKNNAHLVQELPAEKLLKEFETKTYFSHYYNFSIDNFNVANGILSAGFANSSELVYCDRTTGRDTLFFHCLVKPENKDWLVWRPSNPGGYWGRFPRQIQWD